MKIFQFCETKRDAFARCHAGRKLEPYVELRQHVVDVVAVDQHWVAVGPFICDAVAEIAKAMQYETVYPLVARRA